MSLLSLDVTSVFLPFFFQIPIWLAFAKPCFEKCWEIHLGVDHEPSAGRGPGEKAEQPRITGITGFRLPRLQLKASPFLALSCRPPSITGRGVPDPVPPSPPVFKLPISHHTTFPPTSAVFVTYFFLLEG